MEEKTKGTKLTLEIDGVKVSWESPHSDHSVDELFEAFRGLCVTHTFIEDSFISACEEYLEERQYLKEHQEND